MKYPVPESQVDAEVCRAIAKALRKDESVVKLDSSVTEDLGGSSLDFLDITFRLEQAFGIKLPHNLLVDQMEELFGEGSAIDASGRLTRGAIYSDEVPALVTPRALAAGVKEILDCLPATCGSCGASAWKPQGVKVTCGACGKAPQLPDGDTLTAEWLKKVAGERKLFAPA
jgi:acyl carrier protein